MPKIEGLGDGTPGGGASASESPIFDISGVSIGVLPPLTDETPRLTVATATASDGYPVRLEALISDVNGEIYQNWTPFVSGDYFSSLTLDTKTIYRFEVRAVSNLGFESETILSKSWIPGSDQCIGDRVTNLPFADSPLDLDDIDVNNPIKICTAKQWNQIGLDSEYFDKFFDISADIDFKYLESDYNVIGSSGNPFTGTVIGNDRSLSNLKISKPAQDNIGLFGYTGRFFTFKNLNLVDFDIEGKDFASLFVANLNCDTTDRCLIQEVNISGKLKGVEYVGAVAALASRPVQTMVNVNAQIEANSFVGGFFGSLETPLEVNRSSSTGQITGSASGAYLGGAVGQMTGNLSATAFTAISSSINIVAPTSVGIGGLIGLTSGGKMDISDVIANGNVEGFMQVGGCIGHIIMPLSASSFKNMSCTGSVLGESEVGGIVGEVFNLNAALTIKDSLSTGNVDGSTANISSTVGYSHHVGCGVPCFDATITNLHYLLATCTNTAGTCTDPMGTTGHALISYFQGNSTNQPFDSWSFPSIWQVIAGALPVLTWP